MSRELADQVLELFKAQDQTGLSALFDESMKEAVPPAKVLGVWNRIELAGGFLVSSGEPLTAAVPGGELFDYPLRYQKGPHHLQVVIRQKKVSGLLIRPGNPTGRWRRSGGMYRDRVAVLFTVIAAISSWVVVGLGQLGIWYVVAASAWSLSTVIGLARLRGARLPHWL